jgi:hypothetical protein
MQQQYHDSQSYSQLRREQPAPSAFRRDWSRRDPQGWFRVVIVFAGALIGAFVIWPLIRGGDVPGVPAWRHTGFHPYGSPDAPASGSHQRRWRDCGHGSVWNGRLECDDWQDGPPPRDRAAGRTR